MRTSFLFKLLRKSRRHLVFIKRAPVLSLSLDEIKRIIADKQRGRSPCLEVRNIVRHRLEELDERMKGMRRYRREPGATLTQREETGELVDKRAV